MENKTSHKLLASGKQVEVSQSDDGLKLYIKSNLGFLNHYNSNQVALLNGEMAKESVETLVNMPIKAKLRTDMFGNDYFGSHEAYFDENGDMRFGTTPIGTHYKAYIEDAEVTLLHGQRETVVMPCIFAEAIVWKSEFPEYTRAIEERYSKGFLGTSWELMGDSIGDDNGLAESLGLEDARAYDAWTFIGNTIIGVTPAYGNNSRITDIAQDMDSSKILSEALIKDLSNMTQSTKVTSTPSQEDDEYKNKNMHNLSQNQKEAENSERSKDMEEKLLKLESDLAEANQKLKAYEDEGKESEISELKSQVETLKSELAEANAKVETIQTEKSELEDKFVKSTETLEALTSQVEELKPFKEKVDAIEAERAEVEKSAKVEELKAMVTKGGFVSVEELETSEEIKTMLSECNEDALKVLRAERIMKKYDTEDKNSTETSSKKEESVRKDFSEETIVTKNAIDGLLGK